MAAIQFGRSEYDSFTQEERESLNSLEMNARNLLMAMENAVPSDERSDRSRLMNIARTNLEQALLWAEKAILTDPDLK
jgi:hypothetical protein